MKQILIVFIGGGTGSILRYLLSKAANQPNASIPYGTLMVNVLGSLLLGVILGWALKNNTLNHNTTLLLGTGFCGGFTTFSTFAYENQTFLKSGDIMLLGLYLTISIVLGVAAVFSGIWLGDKLF